MGYAENPSAHESAMKPCLSRQRNQALTRTDVAVVLVVLFLALVFLLLTLPAAYSPTRRIDCLANLKQIGIAYQLWAGDHNDRYPMVVSVTNGGVMELVAAGNVAACFRAMSNELSTPRLLVCPQDLHRAYATNFATGFNNTRISYFVGLDVTNGTEPNRFLSGDDHFAVRGVAAESGVLELPTNAPVSWARARHKFAGNIGFADGSVRQVATDRLRKALQQTGARTNRLVIP